MDYIRLVDITNQYPNLPSYVRQNEELVNLFGLYKETNKLEFKLPSIKHITPIDDLNLRLIFGFRKNAQDTDVKYYTSQNFYSDMEASNIEGNPYFYLQSNKVEFIVFVDLEKFISSFQKLKEIENKQGINVLLNNFINSDSSIDYEKLMKFLDWVLSKPTLDEIDTDGVIPADKLALWEVGDYDPILMQWSFNKDKDSNKKLSTSQIIEIEKELAEVNSIISQIEEQLRTGKFNNTNLFRTLGIVGFFPLGLLLLIGNRRRKEEAKRNLEQKLNEYKNRKSELEKTLNNPIPSQSNNQISNQPPSNQRRPQREFSGNRISN